MKSYRWGKREKIASSMTYNKAIRIIRKQLGIKVARTDWPSITYELAIDKIEQKIDKLESELKSTKKKLKKARKKRK